MNEIDNEIKNHIDHIAEVNERIKPLVVIYCITYSLEPYLLDALEVFVM